MTTKQMHNLQRQCISKFKHARAGSFATRARYKQSCMQFVDFLHTQFKMQNLKNLHDKHLAAYITHRQAQGIAAKTIKSDLGAIRYLHDMLDNAKHTLATNQELADTYGITLDRTPAVKGNRAWTVEEYQGMLARATRLSDTQGAVGRTASDVRDVLPICRTMGLRITEVVAMKRSQAENALRTGMYQVKGEAKNGLHRAVPLSTAARTVLTERLKHLDRGELVFTQPTEKVHEAVNRCQKFLGRHRTSITTAEGRAQRTFKNKVNELTYHGLRYGYVQDRMASEMTQGYTYEQAAQRITAEIGHQRIEIIAVYMGNTL